MADYSNLSSEQLQALLCEANKKYEALKAAQPTPRTLSFKVTAKKPDGTGSDGAISVYGLGRFPVTLYAASWERLLAAADDLTAFISANAATISRKT